MLIFKIKNNSNITSSFIQNNNSLQDQSVFQKDHQVNYPST